MQQHGQTLLINSPVQSANSPKGSLSNRFAKIAQGRQKAGVVVVGSGGIETRPGKTLGLGFGTGIPPSQFEASGQRISTRSKVQGGSGSNSNSNSTGGRGLAGMPQASIGKGGRILGIQTSAGLARAMQERGGGASEQLLVNNRHPIVHEARGPGRRRGAPLRGVGRAVETTAYQQQQHPQQPYRQPSSSQQQNRPPRQPRASPYAAAAASRRGPKNSSAPSHAATTTTRQAQSRGQPRAQAAAAAAAGAGASKGKDKKGKAKAKATKPAKATPDSLDSDLTAYMMKSSTTASALLDNDLDTYMAEKPDDLTF
ncbi:hypothetical protein DFQ26_003673 [Actinomortierella ambigua]|nr:hypothetical protein DFQ26_003673 [Actinomortierella ambigua]